MSQIEGRREEKKVLNMVHCAVMAAVMCVLSPWSIPIGPVPITLGTFVLYFSVLIVGMKNTMVSYIVYLALGAIGLPVFSGFRGGVSVLAGPTGGYLLGFIPMIVIMGFIAEAVENRGKALSIAITVLGMILATAVDYLVGTKHFVDVMETSWQYAYTVCVAPFIIFDLGKIVVANILANIVKPRLKFLRKN